MENIVTNKMKRIYNIILIILIICAFIVGSMIFVKYYKNHVNEVKIADKIMQIENDFENLPENETLQVTYEGYNIEGIIEIPNINIKYPIIDITDEETMKLSVTKFWGQNINEIGNYAIAGHNNRDGTMFSKTKHLRVGDIIKITDLRNKTVEYKIQKIYTVEPNDVSIIEPLDSTKREITLITCTNGNKNRLIIKAQEGKI